MTGEPRTLSAREAAAYAGVSYQTVRDWVKAGTLAVVPSRGRRPRWRIRPEAVDVALRRNERPLTAPAARPVPLPIDTRRVDAIERDTLEKMNRLIAGGGR